MQRMQIQSSAKICSYLHVIRLAIVLFYHVSDGYRTECGEAAERTFPKVVIKKVGSRPFLQMKWD